MHNTLNHYLWTCKVDISAYTGPDSHFITLREPTIAEFKEIVKLQKLIEDENNPEYVENLVEMVDRFCSLCTTLIIDHDFFFTDDKGESKKQSSKEVTEFMQAKMELAQEVLSGYMAKLPLLHASKKK